MDTIFIQHRFTIEQKDKDGTHRLQDAICLPKKANVYYTVVEYEI